MGARARVWTPEVIWLLKSTIHETSKPPSLRFRLQGSAEP